MYDNSLIDQLKNFNAYASGGKHILRKRLYVHENLHGEKDRVNLDEFQAYYGHSGYAVIQDSINATLALIKEGNFEKGQPSQTLIKTPKT